MKKLLVFDGFIENSVNTIANTDKSGEWFNMNIRSLHNSCSIDNEVTDELRILSFVYFGREFFEE
jgi:hypothetical protein